MSKFYRGVVEPFLSSLNKDQLVNLLINPPSDKSYFFDKPVPDRIHSFAIKERQGDSLWNISSNDYTHAIIQFLETKEECYVKFVIQTNPFSSSMLSVEFFEVEYVVETIVERDWKRIG